MKGHRYLTSLICLGVISMLAGGCGVFGKINSAKKLAKALQDNGVSCGTLQKQATKTIKCPKNNLEIKIAEVVGASGDQTLLEIVRVKDKKSFEDLKANLGVLLAFTEFSYRAKKGAIVTQAVYPFFVTVIKEPSKNSVKTAMEKIFKENEVESISASQEGRVLVNELKAKLKGMFE